MVTASRLRPTRVHLWWSLGVIVLLAAIAEWMRTPAALWAGTAAAGAMGVALWIPEGSGGGMRRRLLQGALVLLLGSVLYHQHWIGRIQRAWPNELERRIQAAAQQSLRDLDSTFAVAGQLVETGVAVADRSPSGAVDRLIRAFPPGRHPEQGIAVLEADGSLRAWAGTHRIAPTLLGDSIALVASPFFRVLQRRRHLPSGRVVVASVVLDAAPEVPEQVTSMASEFARRTGVGLVVAPPDAIPDSLDPFDFRLPSAVGPRTLYSIRFLPPSQGEALDRAMEEGNHVAVTLLLLVVGLGLLVAPTLRTRTAVLLALLWLTLRAPAGEALGLDTVFSPAVFFPGAFPALLAPFGRSAGTLGFTAILVGLASIVAWRRAGGRTLAGIGVAVVLLALSPVVIAGIGRGITPPSEGTPLALWLIWHVTVLLAATALLLAAAALTRGGKTIAGVWPSLGAAAAGIGAAIAGVALLAGRADLPPWYPLLWYPAALLAIVPVRRGGMILGIGIVAGAAAALVTWRAEVASRVVLAERDLQGLGDAVDPLVEPTLAGLAERLGSFPVPESDGDLYRLWIGSGLERQGYPTSMVLYQHGVRAAVLPLHTVVVADSLLDSLVQALPDTVSQRILTVPSVPGMVQILLARAGDPSGGPTVLAVLAGPRSSLITPTRLGRLLLPHPHPSSLYDIALTSGSSRRTADTLASFPAWQRREARLVRARRLLLPDGVHLAQVGVPLGTPGHLAVRGILLLVLDVAVVALLWLGAERLEGRGAGLRRALEERVRWGALWGSFRVRLGTALLLFFLVPTVGFAVWSLSRLAVQAQESRDLVITEMLRDAASGLARPPVGTIRDRLVDRSERVDAELAFYRLGRLQTSSSSLLTDLALFAPVLPDAAYRAVTAGGQPGVILPIGEGFGHPHRLGYRVYRAPGEVDLAVLATRQVAGDVDISTRQADVAMVLLLGTLLGILGAVWGAGRAARELSRPVGDLRRAALALGSGRSAAPLPPAPPAEFQPVFEAFDRMTSDIRTSQAALEAARRRTDTVLATVATGVIGLDAAGRVLLANRRAADFLGTALSPGESFIAALGAEWASLRAWVAAHLDGSADLEHPDLEIEVGERRFVVQCARLEEGVGGLVIAVLDITETTQAARILAWGEMASQVAHEIKNPLTPMRLGMQHLLRVRRDAPADVAAALDDTAPRMLREIERLDTIARAFSRYAAPALAPGPLHPVAVAALAADVLHLYRLAPGDAVFEVRSDHPIPIAAREDEVREVLINLVENARNAGARHITVEIVGTAFAVIDDGCGIPTDSLPRVFEPRFSTTTSGSGLGLPIVRRLVEGWGATVVLESEPGRGTRVTVTGRSPEEGSGTTAPTPPPAPPPVPAC